MNRSAILCAFAAASASAAVPASHPSPEVSALGPMAERLNNLVGTWRVEARLQFDPAARPLTIEAVAENRLVGGRWLVSELRSVHEGGFHGVEVNGYDPVKGRYSGYWIDSTRSLLVPVEGSYDARSGVFRTTSIERDPGGRSVTIVSETRRNGPDEEVTTFTAPDSAGKPFVRMRLAYRRQTRPAR